MAGSILGAAGQAAERRLSMAGPAVAAYAAPMGTLGRAVRITGPGDETVLEIVEQELWDPGPGEVLVAVRAAGLNRADLLQRQGLYPAPPGSPPDVPGLEYAGEVVAVGKGVSAPRPGEKVMGIVGGGAMATHLLVQARETIPLPEGMTLEYAAAVPEVFVTAWDALVGQAALRTGEVVLVHAVGSGVGSAAVQLAKAAGAIAVGTSRSIGKLRRAEETFGIATVHAEDGRFAEALRARTGARGADVILDTVGAAYLEENVSALASRGRIVVVGLLSGARATLPLGALLAKRARLHGTVLRSRPPEEKALLAQAFRREVLPLLSSGLLRPVVHAVMPMEEVAEAHRRMAADEPFGKIVLRW